MTELDQLAEEWVNAKRAEDQMRARRLDIEGDMLKQIRLKDEGAVTEKTSHWKITATAKLNRKVDWNKFEQIKHTLPENVIPVTYKPELDLTGVRWLEHNQPDIYRQFASCLTVTPAKPYIQVKEIA